MSSNLSGRKPHSHVWLVGVLGIAAGLVLMIFVPSLKGVSEVLILFSGFHLIGGIVLLASAYITFGQRLFRRSARALRPGVDFGWSPAWTFGPLLAALVTLAAAIAVMASAPAWWPVSITLALMASTFFAGYQITASSRKLDHAALPMVDLLSGEEDLVLDGGCGAGRTSLALAPVLKRGKIVALDRFDSDYIEGGGHALLERNARLAGFSDRIQAKMGDLTQLPFPEATFDAAVSAHAMDHLGDAKEAGFREMLRVLKPGRRFLFIAWTPSWSMFAIANVLSFFLTTKAAWRILAARVGFSIVQEGCFNGFWYLLLQKPSEVGAPNA